MAMTRLLLLTALVSLALPDARAEAARFTINPTRLMLSARSTSALLTIQNDGPTPIRLQVTTHAWAQSPAGQMELGSTEDVVVFPTLLTLQPGERRKVRVAVMAAPGDVERTYRVFLEELPPVASPGSQGVAVQMLTRVGIPVFLQPAKVTNRAVLGPATFEGGELKFRVDNVGTTHFVPDAIHVQGLSATGETVVDKSVDGWYILAGDQREYDLQLGSADCGRVRSVLLQVRVGDIALERRLNTPAGTCIP
jgi:fimbrial chaperone protein